MNLDADTLLAIGLISCSIGLILNCIALHILWNRVKKLEEKWKSVPILS